MIDLKQLTLPDQRQKNGTKLENLLTASSLADALGKGHFKTRDDLLISKTSDTKKLFQKRLEILCNGGLCMNKLLQNFMNI